MIDNFLFVALWVQLNSLDSLQSLYFFFCCSDFESLWKLLSFSSYHAIAVICLYIYWHLLPTSDLSHARKWRIFNIVELKRPVDLFTTSVRNCFSVPLDRWLWWLEVTYYGTKFENLIIGVFLGYLM